MGSVDQTVGGEGQRALGDSSVGGIVLSVDSHLDTAHINAGGILVGAFVVGVSNFKGEATGVELNTVGRYVGTSGRLSNGIYHRIVHVVGIGTINKLEIINQNGTFGFGGVWKRNDADCICLHHRNWHLEGGHVGLHPQPTLACPVGQATAGDVAVRVIAEVLDVGDRTGSRLVLMTDQLAILGQLEVGIALIFISSRAAVEDRFELGWIIRPIRRHIDPNADLGGLDGIHIHTGGEAKVCSAHLRSSNGSKVPGQLIGMFAKSGGILAGNQAVLSLGPLDTLGRGIADPQQILCTLLQCQPPVCVGRSFAGAAHMDGPVVFRRSDSPIGPHMILKVHQHQGVHTHNNVDGGGKFAAGNSHLSSERTALVGRELVVGEGAHWESDIPVLLKLFLRHPVGWHTSRTVGCLSVYH